MPVRDRVLQKLGGYTLVLEWDVVGSRRYTNASNERFNLEYGDVTGVRIDADPGETGTLTVKFGSHEIVATGGARARINLGHLNIRLDHARFKEGSHPGLTWRCNYRA